MKKRILALLLVVMVTFSFSACNSNSEDSKKKSSDDVVELKMLSLPANTSGLIDGWWAEEVKKQTGVTIDLLPSGDQGEQKLQALMASGELPDIVVFKDYKQVENAVLGDMLLAYDDYKELLPDLYANATQALKYSADNLSNGQGKSFVVGTAVKNTMEIRGDKEPYLRYDLYKKIGSPKINDLHDYLDVLKQMQELEPVNQDGQKVYGMTMWKDWDRSYLAAVGFAGKFSGVEYAGEATLAEIDHGNNRKVSSILAEDSFYLEFIKFCYDANQMGLLDPDSMTQRFDDAIGKVGSGRVLMSLGAWGLDTFGTVEKQNQGIGFMPVFTENNPTVTEGLEPIGRTWTIAVSKSSKHPEAAMKFINYFYSFEGNMLQANGPKGVMWDLDENNKPYVLEEGYEYMKDVEKELPEGRSFGKGYGITAVGLNGTTLVPDYGTPISNAYWDKKEYAPADTKLVDIWQEDFGAEDSIDYLSKRGDKNGLKPMPFIAQPIYTDEMEQISARVGDVVKTVSWKMIFAKDEKEYEALKKEMIEKAEGMGIDKFVDWYSAEYAKAIEFGKQYVDQ